MKVSVFSLGCKVNIYESEFVTNLLQEKGYQIVDFADKADIYIINTCSVTNESDKKSRKVISRARKNNPDSIIVVMGCYSQVSSEEVEADIIIGNKDKSKIVELIEEYQKEKQKQIKIYDLSEVEFEPMEIHKFETHTRAFVKIQDGCNAFCSYCIIPYTRGRVRSKKEESVISEVTNLVNNGYKEIVLTGIHTGRYGIDINTNLETLLKKLVQIPDIFRIRLSSIEINEITPGIIDLIKNNEVMAKHLHVPLQSGSNKILKLMNRKYNKEEFLEKIKILKEIPNISLTTDLIVGFPNEGEEEFAETIATLKQISFTKIHTFPYSRRKGTPADKMNNQIPTEEKKKRVHKVIELSDVSEENFYKNNIGKILNGVVENRDNKTVVLTSNYIPVIIEEKAENNSLVNIQITKVDQKRVYGKII